LALPCNIASEPVSFVVREGELQNPVGPEADIDPGFLF
jgi:hypothetical protein